MGIVIILAVDPGLVSGYASWTTTGRYLEAKEIPYQECGQHVHGILEGYRTSAVDIQLVVERYTMTTGIKTAQPEALKTMGQLELLAQLYDVHLHYYLPATTKKMISNARLKDVGWYRYTRDGHCNDAARLIGVHLLTRYPEIAGRIFGI